MYSLDICEVDAIDLEAGALNSYRYQSRVLFLNTVQDLRLYSVYLYVGISSSIFLLVSIGTL